MFDKFDEEQVPAYRPQEGKQRVIIWTLTLEMRPSKMDGLVASGHRSIKANPNPDHPWDWPIGANISWSYIVAVEERVNISRFRTLEPCF